MRQDHVKATLEKLVEELASIEHERWSHWQRYMHGKGVKMADGSLVIPADLIERWERQMSTAYANLAEDEKDSDREQVRNYLPVIEKALSD